MDRVGSGIEAFKPAAGIEEIELHGAGKAKVAQNSRSGSRSNSRCVLSFRNPISCSGVRMGRSSMWPSFSMTLSFWPGLRSSAFRISLGMTTWYLGDKSEVVIRKSIWGLDSEMQTISPWRAGKKGHHSSVVKQSVVFPIG
jgi:hypothetical protein